MPKVNHVSDAAIVLPNSHRVGAGRHPNGFCRAARNPIPTGKCNRVGSPIASRAYLRDGAATSHPWALGGGIRTASLLSGPAVIFHLGDHSRGNCVQLFHALNPAPVNDFSRVFAS